MSRLTDERLANICRAPVDVLDDVTNGEISSMSDELKERRAADLSPQDKRALRFLIDHVVMTFAPCRDKGTVLDVLDKVLGGRK